MEQYLKRTWAEVDLDAIAHNYNMIRKAAGDAECMCIVKADAYGHGAIPVARQLFDCGARFFAVSNIEEALQLRDGGISGGILILGYTPPEFADVLYINDISQTVFSVSGARQLAEAAHGRTIKVHIKLDTGMSRLGLNGGADEMTEQALAICGIKGLRIEGLFTHFARADEKNDEATKAQFDLFSEVAERLAAAGVKIKFRHCCNSAGLLAYPQYLLNMCRPGLILYGLSPFGGEYGIPAMTLKTVVSQIKTIPAGTPISYGGRYVTERESRIAVLPVGYADGFARLLSGKAQVLINGERVNTVGNICMDMTMADITGKNVSEGDVAVIIGSDGSDRITAEDIAKLTGTIPYEVISLIGKRVPRVFIRNGEIVGSTGLLEH
ncbi:MAG: alanine racemase [Clostridia bacterium]|nr:alanine racemase [Clostridia bacterium]